MRWNDRLFKQINEQIKNKECKIFFSYVTSNNKYTGIYSKPEDFLNSLWAIYNEHGDSIIRIIAYELPLEGNKYKKKLYEYTATSKPKRLNRVGSNNWSIFLYKDFDKQTRNVYNKLLMAQIREFTLDDYQVTNS